MSTTAGQLAEQYTANHLEQLGFQILGQNWRTRWCEIDIIAYAESVLYFVEVKYRRTTYQGDGLAYITPRKLRQMHFAARVWIAAHNWRGRYEVAAVAVGGPEFNVGELVICS